MPDGSFTIRDLADVIAKMLGLREGETVEIKRNRLDRDRLMIIRHGEEQKPA